MNWWQFRKMWLMSGADRAVWSAGLWPLLIVVVLFILLARC